MAAMWDILVWSDPDACGRVVGASVVNKREQSSGGDTLPKRGRDDVDDVSRLEIEVRR